MTESTQESNKFVDAIRDLITKHRRLETEQEIIESAAKQNAEKEIFSDV